MSDDHDGFAEYMIAQGVIKEPPMMTLAEYAAKNMTEEEFQEEVRKQAGVDLAFNEVLNSIPFVESTSPTLTYKPDSAMLGVSKFERNDRDLYPTIDLGVTHALCRTLIANGFINPFATIWEPACGDWTMAKVLEEHFGKCHRVGHSADGPARHSGGLSELNHQGSLPRDHHQSPVRQDHR
jgi:hypothetical protein